MNPRSFAPGVLPFSRKKFFLTCTQTYTFSRISTIYRGTPKAPLAKGLPPQAGGDCPTAPSSAGRLSNGSLSGRAARSAEQSPVTPAACHPLSKGGFWW